MEIAFVEAPRLKTEPSRFLLFVEQSSARQLAFNPFLLAAKNGQVKPRHLETYLNNLRHLFQASNLSLKMAAQAALLRGKKDLANFYSTKVAEEAGHEKWAEEDLAANALHLFEESKQASPSMRKLVDFSRQLIPQSPELFLSYVLYLEYFTVLAGPEFLKNLEEKCAIPREKVSALYNHVVLDQKHAAEDNAMIAGMLETDLADQAYDALIELEFLVSAFLADSLDNTLHAS